MMISHSINLVPRYLVLLYVALFAMIARYWPLQNIDVASGWIFAVLATAAYAGLYLLPVALLAWGATRLCPVDWPYRVFVVALTCAFAGSLALLAVYADYQLYLLYDYHFNAFVWNLLTTPGGIAALGATAETEQTAMLIVAGFVGANGMALLVLYLLRHRGVQFSLRPVLWSLAFLIGLLAGEEVVYAYSVHTGEEAVLEAANVIPFHLHTGAKRLFSKLGIERKSVQDRRLAGGQVNYAGRLSVPVGVMNNKNVIMLVAESFRWDLLDPEITPNLWRFSQRARRFENHYSGGNRTRMGLFSMFYGIYAPYWYSFEEQRVAPVLMDAVRQRGDRLLIHTSQSFDYPELRHTVFSGVSEEVLREIKTGEPWQRDVQNVDEIMQKLGQRVPGQSTFAFMFFESTHAPYSFPEAEPLRRDYLHDMNYLKLNLSENIDGIHARYINAAHHIDTQVGRLLAYLEQRGMLDNTILLFTGDHGEEFMEKGRWGHGHNNTFPEEQVRVPLVWWEPGVSPAVIHHRTSHLQIPASLLRSLGVDTPSRNYSSADPLEVEMPYFVFGSYDYMGISDGKNKITFPYTGRDFFRYAAFDEADHPVSRSEREALIDRSSAVIERVAQESRRFVR